MSDLTILIPAAGASSRMRGEDKLLRAIDGEALLRRTTQMALAAHPHVLVTLRPEDAARRQVIRDLPVTVLEVTNASAGLSASLVTGSAAAKGSLMILPADMPDLTTQDLRLLIDAATQSPGAILRATTAEGLPGHPVLFPPDLLPAFAALTGDEGARSILQAHRDRVRMVALPGDHAMTDLDTPEAWAAWAQSAKSTRTS